MVSDDKKLIEIFEKALEKVEKDILKEYEELRVIPHYETDIVVRVAHKLLSNKYFNSNYYLTTEYSILKGFNEDLIITERKKENFKTIFKGMRPKEVQIKNIKIVAEFKRFRRSGDIRTHKILRDEAKRLKEIKSKGLADYTYLILFTSKSKPFKKELIEKLEKDVNFWIFYTHPFALINKLFKTKKQRATLMKLKKFSEFIK